MKKAIVFTVLILSILTSVVAGTMANYTTNIDNLASGSVVGKEFVFLEDGQDTFQHNIKIAPTETVIWQFGVRNFENNVITETNLNYNLTFDVLATPGKSAIDPLIVTVKDELGNVLTSVTGVGNLNVSGTFPLSAQGQSASYTVEIYWPSNDAIDINYAGNEFSTTVNVSAVASQLPILPQESEDPEDNGSDPNSVYTVEYQRISDTWIDNNGKTRYDYVICVTNNSNKKINNWSLDFLGNGQLLWTYDAIDESAGLPAGSFEFTNPQNYNKHIEPGASVSFGGQAVQDQLQGIHHVTLNGVPVNFSNVGM